MRSRRLTGPRRKPPTTPYLIESTSRFPQTARKELELIDKVVDAKPTLNRIAISAKAMKTLVHAVRKASNKRLQDDEFAHGLMYRDHVLYNR